MTRASSHPSRQLRCAPARSWIHGCDINHLQSVQTEKLGSSTLMHLVPLKGSPGWRLPGSGGDGRGAHMGRGPAWRQAALECDHGHLHGRDAGRGDGQGTRYAIRAALPRALLASDSSLQMRQILQKHCTSLVLLQIA